MEIRNHTTNMLLTDKMQEALRIIRDERAFSAEMMIDKKINLLNKYYRESGLKSAVVAVSGGIDSAVVLGLVALTQQQPNSPIERIVAVTMPDKGNLGVTGQTKAAILANQVCKAFAVNPLEIDISTISEAIVDNVEAVLGQPSEEKYYWCRGQVTSYARTPTYYYITSVLAAQGQSGLVIGTTNLSEGGYLGYFGKASDGMVDIQLISDLYKSEVYAIGKMLGVPVEILDRPPTGDMFDACSDEVVFGAPYDFVEIFQECKRNSMAAMAIEDLLTGDDISITQFDEYSANLERMHQYNAHKYIGRSPAVHLDIMECGIPGGWENPAWK